MRIWKYKLKWTDVQRVKMPSGAKLLSVATQTGSLCLWAMVDQDAVEESRIIEIIGTGNPIPDGVNRVFIGTAIVGPFVWHVFEIVQPATV